MKFRPKFRPIFFKKFGDFGQNTPKFERAGLHEIFKISVEIVKFRVFWSWPKKNAKRNPKPWLHTPSQQPAKLLITAGSYTNTTMTPKTFRVQYVRYSVVCLSTAKARTMSSLCISGLLPCTLSVS